MRLLLPDLIAIGMDGMQSVQPFCTGMELNGLKQDFGADFTFFGGIDTQVLIEGSVEDARQLTRHSLEIMMPGGGYVCSPSHDFLLPETPVENVIAVYETIQEYGGYS
jgi:uroporphyrinogen decarboxylase